MDRADDQDELTQLSVLDPEAMTILQRFAKDFLKNCFNSTHPSPAALTDSILRYDPERHPDGTYQDSTIR